MTEYSKEQLALAERLLAELFETGFNKRGRPKGLSPKSLDFVVTMRGIAEAAQPITGRGIGYKLFSAGLIPSMSRKDMQRVYRLLKLGREQGIIPWSWIVDETRGIEKAPSWNDPEEFAQAAGNQYRLDYWSQQPIRCQVWSEKGTVRGVLKPVLDKYGVGFNAVHGFNSATNAYDACNDHDRRPLTVLYVGDYDPSGLYMSEVDIPARNVKYGGHHITVMRIALTPRQLDGLPSFAASDKRKDPRYRWFIENYQTDGRCWELDALDPNTLRDRVEAYIRTCIRDGDAWARCETATEAQQESLKLVLNSWANPEAV
jgi:hypothetical protein